MQPITYAEEHAKMLVLLTHYKQGSIVGEQANPYLNSDLEKEDDTKTYLTLVEVFRKQFKDSNLRNKLVDKLYSLE